MLGLFRHYLRHGRNLLLRMNKATIHIESKIIVRRESHKRTFSLLISMFFWHTQQQLSDCLHLLKYSFHTQPDTISIPLYIMNVKNELILSRRCKLCYVNLFEEYKISDKYVMI